MYIDEETEFTINLTTNSGTLESLSNILAFNRSAGDLYDLLIGCAWDADAVAELFNENSHLMYVHDWYGSRTLPRMLVLGGTDSCGNNKLLYIKLGDHEPDMTDSRPVLSLSLTNQARVPLSISNIMAHGCSSEDLLDYLYEAFDYTAEGFADAANRAWYNGVLLSGGWTAGYTREDKCRINSQDSMGNDRILIIRIS